MLFRSAAGGLLHVDDISAVVHPLCGSFLQAARTLGFAHTDDFNGPSGEGVGIYQINTRKGWRESTASAFLRPALARANLGLHTQAHATRVLIDDGRAVGVEYARDGQLLQALARREVVICGGTVNSPQLLQLSGIGDAPLLAQHSIRVAVHAPMVGKQLQDHLHITHSYRSRAPSLNDQLFPWTGKLRAALQYLVRRSAPLA